MPRAQDMTDSGLAKALSHPLRGRILAALENRTASPSELSEDLNSSLGVVSYHVRQLHALGFIRLVKRVPRRGAVEHYYTTVAGARISSQVWESAPTVVKQALLGATLREIGSQASAAAEAGGFESREAHLSRSPVTVDTEGFRELASALDALVSRIERITAESQERLSQADRQAEQAAEVALMLFHTGIPEGASDVRRPASARPRGRRATTSS